MNAQFQFQRLLDDSATILALAPMQDVTDLAFWKLTADYGGADLYFTEYFRVHSTSNLETWILRSITENPTRRPVIAQVIGNDIPSLAQNADEILRLTGAKGLMIGRGAIRNPWLFHQIRQQQRGERPFVPRGRDVLAYVRALYDAVSSPDAREMAQVQKMKKYMNYLGLGVEPTGQFLHQIRRVATRADFFRVCQVFLSHYRLIPLEH